MDETVTLKQAVMAWADGKLVQFRFKDEMANWQAAPVLDDKNGLSPVWSSEFEYRVRERNPKKQQIFFVGRVDENGYLSFGQSLESLEGLPDCGITLTLDVSGRQGNFYVGGYDCKLVEKQEPDEDEAVPSQAEAESPVTCGEEIL